MRRRLPAGVRMYTGDDFNYAELIAGDEKGHSDALLGIFDAIAPAASAALGELARGGREPVLRHPGADGAAVAAHLRGADAVLQDGRGVSRLPQRAAGAFRDGGRAAERAVAAASRRALPAGRPGGGAPGPGSRGGADAGGAGGAGRPMTPVEGLSINLATVRAQWDMAAAVDGCLRHGITAIAPWRDQVAAIGLARAARLVRDEGLRVTGLCRGGFFPAPTAEERARAVEDNLRAVDEAAALGADCLVHGGGRAAGGVAGSWARRGRWCGTGWRRCCRMRGRRGSGWRSSRCIRSMRRTGRA